MIYDKNFNWEKLSFSYHPVDRRYISYYRDGAWSEGFLSDDSNVVINEAAGVLQYSQTCFEGLKAYRTKDGEVVTFRPDMNAIRISNSAKRLEIPPFPEEKFLEAVDMVVAANIDFVPPYSSGASLYLRPTLFGTSPVIGVGPSKEFEFRLFCTPVGPYFQSGINPISLKVSDFDRAAPRGTGCVKAGLNYAMSLYPLGIAHREGFSENIYLDAATRTFVEETGGANIIFITKDNKFVTPDSPTILPSITRNSLEVVAREYLGIEVEERPVAFSEVKEFIECGLCGTGAVISPVGRIVSHDEEIIFPESSHKMGKTLQKLYDVLLGIQHGNIPAPEGWIRHISRK